MRTVLSSALAAAALLVAGRAGAYTLVDSLKDFAPKGTPVGGSFGANGWTVTQKSDLVYYALPRLVEGSIEFTLTGMTTSSLVLADHEIFAMYDAGYGIAEPINYNPEFRDNHYKALLRVYGEMVPDRLGEQKFVMLMCPDGAPGYGACVCPKSFYDGDGWWGGDPSWSGAPTVIKIRWGNGTATYSRDGVDVWTNDYTQSGLAFGPSELHFTLGCPRNAAIGDAGMPIGATFSDVVVQGIEGPLETCAGGAGGSGGGGSGACDPAAPITAVSLTPTAGAGPAGLFVARYAHCEGASAFRVVQLLVGDPEAGAAYVAPGFEASQLHLGGGSCVPGEAKVLTDTYGSLDCAATTVASSGDEITVAWALSFDVATFAGPRGVWFDAKGGSVAPEPRLGWTPMGQFTVQAGSGGGAGGGGGDGGAGPGPSGFGGVDEGDQTYGGGAVDGCACRVHAAGTTPWAALALLAAATAARRRRVPRRG